LKAAELWSQTAATYYNAVAVIENHLRFVIGRCIVLKRLVNVYKSHVNAY